MPTNRPINMQEWLSISNGDMYDLYRTPTEPTLRQKRAQEKASLERFSLTGEPSGITLLANADGLTAKSHTISGQKILFTLNRQEIVALESRTKHLRKQLIALAEREGLRLTFVDEIVVSDGPTVFLWVFDNLEVDDSALMLARPVIQAPPTPPDGCVCGDPDCPASQAEADIPF